jgi:hypothetical protein
MNLASLTKIRRKKTMERIKGTVERVNPRGVRIDGRWYNYSKYIKNTPKVNEGDEVEVDINGDWIMGLKILSRQLFEARENKGNHYTEREKGEVERQVVITRLACLNTATEVLKSHAKPITSENLFKSAEELEDWVWRSLKEERKEDELDQDSEGEALAEAFGVEEEFE